MTTFWLVQAGIGAVAIGASVAMGVACSSSSGPLLLGPPSGTDSGTGFPPGCLRCACMDESGDAPAGCADTCDYTISGATRPDFCNGASALAQCKMCIASRCGVTDPTMCN